MNKKVILSVLSTALVTSMATSAFAAAGGVYIGGNVDRFYSDEALIKQTDKFVADLYDSGLENVDNSVLYVNWEGKAATLQELADAQKNGTEVNYKTVTSEDFEKIGGEEGFYAVDGQGNVSTEKEMQPEQKPVAPGDLNVESVSAINSKTVVVKLHNAIESVDRDVFTVVTKDSGTKQYIQTATLSTDKKEVTLKFYDALKSKSTYVVSYKSGDKILTKEFDFVVGEVAKIEASNMTIPATTPTALDYKVFDAAGLDITADTKVSFDSSIPTAIDNGKITLGAGEVAFVVVTYTKADGTVVKSNRITVEGTANVATKLNDFTIADAKLAEDDWKATDFKPVHIVKIKQDKVISINAQDQFGKYSNNPAEFESLNKEVLLVDRTSGKLTPLKTGSADVRIKAGKINEIVTIQVGEEAKLGSISLDKNQLDVSDKVTTAQTVKVSLKDQFNDAFTGTQVINATVKPGGEDVITINSPVSAVNGEATFSITPKKAGTAVVEFSAANTDKKVTLTVNVKEAGVINDYVVEGFKAELDKHVAENSKFKLSVYGVDANGTATGNPIQTGVTYSIFDKDGKAVTKYDKVGISEEVKADDLTTGETYTLKVKVGDLEVYSKSLVVKDSEPKPVVTQTGGTLEVTAGTNILDELKTNYFEVNFEGKVNNAATIEGIKFYSDDVNVVDSSFTDFATSINAKAEGQASLVVTDLKVKIGSNVYDVKTNAIIDVKVGAKPALNDAQAVDAAKAALNITFTGSETANTVENGFDLTTAGLEGTSITWVSDKAGVITVNGNKAQVTRSADNETVTLTATISKNAENDTKEFTLTVLADDTKAVDAAKTALDITFANSETIDAVESNFTVPTSGSNGTAITWESSKTSVISVTNGQATVTRPNADETVTLTATISKNGVEQTKTFTLTVKQA
ncbi:immunoglobulin-like domain-containing protein [Brevibacillus laterosporus]|uniref:immunoglobulin-like domain-containing protein n=1 Tax=Brevibacillus laterosporus TaxID=1465 RepID=UPI0020CBF74B|nr:immunoglobulin-like domain-containing protein [Brevibacillus laterosporus]